MKNILPLFLLFFSLVGFAQVNVKGAVKDSIGDPLELANVIAINKTSQALESFDVTDENGVYELKLKKNTQYDLKVSYLGMKTIEEILETKEVNLEKNFSMQFDNLLDEVELTYEMPVTIKGDTLVYNADSFKNGTERKLEDVLEKLPGVEINDDGQVEVEGKVVNKVLVNGKDFFDGDSKLATKNIPSSAVDKIQVLKNFSEVGQLRSVTNNQDNVALNIKLKEGKENFWFGNVTAGGGSAPEEGLYLLQPKLFYYSPKFSLNFIGDMNNLGEVALSRQDLRNFGGGFGFNIPSNNSGTSINLGNNSLSFLTSQNNAVDVENKLGATNFSYSPSDALDISGFAIYNSTRIASNRSSFIQYTDENLGIPDEATQQISTEKSDQGLVKLSASYKPNVNNQVDYDVLGRLSQDEQDQNFFSSVLGNTDQFDEVTPFSINQNLNYYYTLNENNIFAFYAQHLIKDEDPFYSALLVNDPTNNNDPVNSDAFDSTADALGFDTSLNNYNIGQNRRIKSNQLDSKLDYYHIINSKSNINVTLGTILSKQLFDSDMFQILADGSLFAPTPNFNNGRATNDTEYNFSDVYLAFHYRLRAGKFTITPGVSGHSYVNKNSQFNENFRESFFRFLPDFETRIQFKNSESLTFRYNIQNQFTDVTRLAQGLVLNNFNSIQFGEPELQNALSHNLRLFYQSFNLFNYTNVFASINYSKNIDQIRSITNFENVITTSSFFNSAFADESISSFGRFQRTFGKIRASVRVGFNYSKNNQFIENVRSLNENISQTYTPEIRTNFRKAPNFRLRYRYGINTNKQGGRETVFYTHVPSVDFDAYIWDAITFRTDYAFNRQQEKGGDSETFQTWNASLSYRKNRDAKWEYEVKATNLLNIDSRVSNNAGNISVSNTEIFIQPRFVSFRVRYEL
ncbi:MAG: carboxypeptidase-like regulatory domain-containing protein [Flavobacteriaceae bacterium]|nr:carboxypeptidase-like regulatory domain-containing protein [Flavobacteriaceae bacterium]